MLTLPWTLPAEIQAGHTNPMKTNFEIRVCASVTAGEPLDSPAIRPAFAASGSEY